MNGWMDGNSWLFEDRSQGKRISKGNAPFGWLTMAESVRGSTHVLRNMPNQDAIAWKYGRSEDHPVAVALADGHGSPLCSRSRVGAKLAVASAIQAGKCLMGLRQSINHPVVARSAIDTWLIKLIVHKWREAVKAHFSRLTLTEEERDLILSRSGGSRTEWSGGKPGLPLWNDPDPWWW